MTSEQLKEALSDGVVGIENADVVTDKETHKSRGFAFVEFYNTQAAEAARKKWSRNELK